MIPMMIMIIQGRKAGIIPHVFATVCQSFQLYNNYQTLTLGNVVTQANGYTKLGTNRGSKHRKRGGRSSHSVARGGLLGF